MSEEQLEPRDSENFSPSRTQSIAKTRFWNRFNEEAGFLDLESLSRDDVVRLAGTKQVTGWLKDQGFARWFFEKDSLVHRIQSLKETAVDVLEEVLLRDYEDRVLTAKDKLKAVDLLLQVTGSYPSRTKEIVFADARINAMSDEEVEKELEATRKTLVLPAVRPS